MAPGAFALATQLFTQLKCHSTARQALPHATSLVGPAWPRSRQNRHAAVDSPDLKTRHDRSWPRFPNLDVSRTSHHAQRAEEAGLMRKIGSYGGWVVAE